MIHIALLVIFKSVIAVALLTAAGFIARLLHPLISPGALRDFLYMDRSPTAQAARRLMRAAGKAEPRD